jgi:hypothetical protein
VKRETENTRENPGQCQYSQKMKAKKRRKLNIEYHSAHITFINTEFTPFVELITLIVIVAINFNSNC